MKKIFNIKLNKDFLKTVDKSEISLLFAIAHLKNEATALKKLFFWTTTYEPSNEADSFGNLTYKLMFLRNLAGKLYEGHKLLKKGFYGNMLSKKYIPELTQESREALDNIKNYFDKESNIKKIRNSFAFHIDSKKFEDVFADAPDNFDLFIEEGGSSNNLYYFGEVIAGRALLNTVGNLSNANVLNDLGMEILKVGGWFSIALDGLLVAFIKQNGDIVWEDNAIEIKFSKLSSMMEVRIPWFTDPTDAYKLL